MAHKRYTISTKLNEHDNTELSRLAERENISVSAIMKLCSDALLSGDIELEKGELKMCTPPHENSVSELSDEDFRENMRYKELRFDKLLSAFERKKYPDEAIRSSVEQIIGSVLDGPDYSSRRSNYDWGC